MAIVSGSTLQPANPTGEHVMTREYKSEAGPFTFILMRPDRSVRTLSGRNLHANWCPIDQEGATMTGETDATIVFPADWKQNLLSSVAADSRKQVGNTLWGNNPSFQLTFNDWLATLNPEEGVQYLRCRISDKNMPDEFIQRTSKRKDGSTFVEKAAYTFIRKDSKFLNVNAHGEHALLGSDGKVHNLYGENATWSVGTPGRMAGPCKVEPCPKHLEGLTSLINNTMPANEEEAKGQFCSELIPSHVFVALFGTGFTDNPEEGSTDSRLFVDDRERYTEFLATQKS